MGECEESIGSTGVRVKKAGGARGPRGPSRAREPGVCAARVSQGSWVHEPGGKPGSDGLCQEDVEKQVEPERNYFLVGTFRVLI